VRTSASAQAPRFAGELEAQAHRADEALAGQHRALASTLPANRTIPARRDHEVTANTYPCRPVAMIAPQGRSHDARVLTATAFSASASPSCERGTTSEGSRRYTGQRIASPMPLANTSTRSTGAVRWPASAKL